MRNNSNRLILLFGLALSVMVACKDSEPDPTPYITTSGKSPKAKMAGVGGGTGGGSQAGGGTSAATAPGGDSQKPAGKDKPADTAGKPGSAAGK